MEYTEDSLTEDEQRLLETANGSKPTVLVIDDEPRILDAVADLLEDEYLVLTAPSGEAGLRILAERPDVAIILSDQRMPKMDGAEFFRLAQAHSAAARILFSGFTDFGALVRAINDGHIFAYLAKPFDAVSLREAVRSALQSRSGLKN